MLYLVTTVSLSTLTSGAVSSKRPALTCQWLGPGTELGGKYRTQYYVSSRRAVAIAQCMALQDDLHAPGLPKKWASRFRRLAPSSNVDGEGGIEPRLIKCLDDGVDDKADEVRGTRYEARGSRYVLRGAGFMYLKGFQITTRGGPVGRRLEL